MKRALFVLVLAPSLARADAPSWVQQLQINASAEVGWTCNFNRPQSNSNQYRSFDAIHNRYIIPVGHSLRIDCCRSMSCR